jgi:hypothetical protein
MRQEIPTAGLAERGEQDKVFLADHCLVIIKVAGAAAETKAPQHRAQ